MNLLTKIPEELYQLRGLRGLSLLYNRIGGLISNSIGNLTSLETLQLQVNTFSPQLIPKEICNLRNLKSLDMSDTRVMGPMPDCLFNMTNLNSLLLSGTGMMCTLNPNISNLINLKSLALSYSSFYGTIPESIGNLTNLLYLGLNRNLFTQTLPTSITRLQKLKTLLVQENSLHGRVDFITSMNVTLLKMHENFSQIHLLFLLQVYLLLHILIFIGIY